MFLDELTPIFKEFTQHPLSFMGGFVSGALRLNLAEDPVKSWLEEQLGHSSNINSANESHNGKAKGPQQISIE
ncbi:hypothetical protein [Mastigocoleus testarum]|uniref:Uncharacterized protein n=1 Tax=Mastigocoleus testarum BC008 TaxID=371196 RepID=A0A0V7ZZJ6_9CYAN|nr:hypothetical protein [Mastigocoleus testarum]KST67605.1 hypothetical protein BC008_30900 [Mastigocoleus testarum BC008]KST69759.1 hypothetical protein BC008_35950 [Mastigocoleus testarum BC008]